MLEMPRTDVNIRERQSLELAFLGDSVLSLLARARLVAAGRKDAGTLHEQAVGMVSARAQAAALAKLTETLTAEEQNIVRRAKNSAPRLKNKSHTAAEYRDATALEALFGWLYAQGDGVRIQELFNIISRIYEESADLK